MPQQKSKKTSKKLDPKKYTGILKTMKLKEKLATIKGTKEKKLLHSQVSRIIKSFPQYADLLRVNDKLKRVYQIEDKELRTFKQWKEAGKMVKK